MASRLADYYESYYRDKLGSISCLDYNPDFMKHIKGSSLEVSIRILDGLLRQFAEQDSPRVLEAGVGSGALMHWFRHRGLDPEGVDISETVVENLKARGFKVSVHDLNESGLAFPEHSFHLAVSLDVIEHVICPVFFMSELHRVCKPGGYAMVSTANIRSLKRIFHLLFRGRFPQTAEEQHGWDCGHLHYFTSKDISDLGMQAGFETVQVLGASPESTGPRGALKKLFKALLPRGFTREFFDGSFIVLFRK